MHNIPAVGEEGLLASCDLMLLSFHYMRLISLILHGVIFSCTDIILKLMQPLKILESETQDCLILHKDISSLGQREAEMQMQLIGAKCHFLPTWPVFYMHTFI